MTPRQKLFLGVSYLAIATSIVGAIALASASLPFQLGKARPMLKKGGLAAISTGLSIGSLGEFGVGLNHKQPTLTFANLVFALAAPIFMKDSRLIRGVFLAMMGSYYAGYASVIGAQNPNAKHTQEAVDHPFRPDNFIKAMVRDHLLVLKAFGRIMPLLGGLFNDVTRAAKAVISGERVDIPPSADRVRLSSALHYIGGAVLMILGRKNPKLAALGSGIAAVGGLGSNLEWFAVGTQRNDLVGTALKIGFPMQVVGKATFHTNLGYAVEMAGEGLSYALTSDLNKPK